MSLVVPTVCADDLQVFASRQDVHVPDNRKDAFGLPDALGRSRCRRKGCGCRTAAPRYDSAKIGASLDKLGVNLTHGYHILAVAMPRATVLRHEISVLWQTTETCKTWATALVNVSGKHRLSSLSCGELCTCGNVKAPLAVI